MKNNKKNTGSRRGFKSFAAALAAVLLAASLSVTALADGELTGNIIIKNASAEYEYKVYELLICISLYESGGPVYLAAEEWKDFLETNENAAAVLTPSDFENGITNEDSGVYTVNARKLAGDGGKDFAADVLQYAQENGVEPTRIMTVQDGDKDVSFTDLELGICVVDTAGRAATVVMEDMIDSEIKESYKPEDKTPETGTGSADTNTGSTDADTESSDADTESSNAGTKSSNADTESSDAGAEEDTDKEAAQNTESQKTSGDIAEEGSTGEASQPAEEETPKGSSVTIIIIIAAAAVLAV